MSEIHKMIKNGVVVYPATTTDAVVDPKKRKSLTKRLSDYVSLYNVDYENPLSEGYYTSGTARNAVPADIRKKGIIITYKTDATTTVIEQYLGTIYVYPDWNTENNWITINNAVAHKILTWNTDVYNTRYQVPNKERKSGLLISYKNGEGKWINEQYIGEILTSSDEWIKDENWKKIPSIDDIISIKTEIDKIKIPINEILFLNAFEENFLEDNSYYNNKGVLTTTDGYYGTDKIQCIGGQDIYIAGEAKGGLNVTCPYINLYNDSGDFISSIANSQIIPAGTTGYIKFSIPNNEEIKYFSVYSTYKYFKELQCFYYSPYPNIRFRGLIPLSGIYFDNLLNPDKIEGLALALNNLSYITEKINESNVSKIIEGFGQFDFYKDGAYIDKNTGLDVSYANMKVTDYIDARNISSIEVSMYGIVNIVSNIACYDMNKSYLSSKSIGPTEGSSGTWGIAKGSIINDGSIAFIRLCRNNGSLANNDTIKVNYKYSIFEDYPNTIKRIEALENVDSPWKGKKWYAFGTSLTDYRTKDLNGDPTGKYTYFLNDWMQADLINCGKGGGSICPTVNGLIMDAIENTEFSDADLVTLEGFANDFGYPLGDFLDTTDETLAGCLYIAIKKIYEKAPNATVVLITESQGKLKDDGKGYPIDFGEGRQYLQNELIKQVGNYMGCHVIEAGSKSQINNFHPDYLIDQIHHTWKGGLQYALTIWEELKNIHCNTDVVVDEEECRDKYL